MESAIIYPDEKFEKSALEELLSRVLSTESCGRVLRAKGVLHSRGGCLIVDGSEQGLRVVACGMRCVPQLRVIGEKIDGGRLQRMLRTIAI